jgi:flagellar basal body rod protein FlgG
MIRSLYTAASGLETGLHMQEAVAENLANSTTTGYKSERSAAAAFAGVLARTIGNAPVPVPLALERVLGTVGTGSYVDKRRVSLDPGTADVTGRPLDVMLQGSGFFVVQAADGTPRYTRDGHFALDKQGNLVTAEGNQVLDATGAPIVLATDNVRIDGTGQIFTRTPIQVTQPDGTVVTQILENFAAQLQVVTAGPTQLVRAGQSDFTLVPNAAAVPATLGGSSKVQQGALEQSNVDVTSTSTQLMTLARNYSASQHVFATINQTLDEAVNQIGKVA